MSLFALMPTLMAMVGRAIAVNVNARSIRNSRNRGPGSAALAPTDAVLLSLIRSARIRIVSATVVTVAVGIVVASLPIDGFATALAIAPGLAVTAGLALIAIAPLNRRARSEPVRRADFPRDERPPSHRGGGSFSRWLRHRFLL
ncbi:MAG: hypothetical protein H7248_03755 [Microbacteriaceae bacterium]|nr:hypothetical protein [Microbacteriaceae bacterium]